MKHVNRKFFAALLAFMLCALGALAPARARAAEGDYILKDGNIYRVDGGKERLLEDESPQSGATDAGIWSWVQVDPEYEGMEGSEGGVYFFLGEDEKPAGFLPMESAGSCELAFSPSGEKLLVNRSAGDKQDLGLYLVDAAKKTFVRQRSFVGIGVCFWVDPHRFIYNRIDEDRGIRKGSEDIGWYSAVLYDSVENAPVVIKEASATKNYLLAGFEHETGTLELHEVFVKDEKDWADGEKIDSREITAPIPAAG